ncbi:MAG: hydrolase, CocE/NonD family [uncultured Rubrobacteraceae bacterium]|uniref:Hydrolase, CocE/NonD family n=1 Tax=uncultured Rubrobacteraceae bacterium TaxID=349277 RepID=A0A6J4Q606_9ACTN|nr:MAG: hydrolase, CocE/NonD family [uncultured Rubrobacteraceae bacterium]
MTLAQEIIVQRNVPAEMRDGTTLVADVYRPGGEASDAEYPVLLTRQPYGKELPTVTGYLNAIKAAGRGYVVVIQDVRGRFGSEGEWNPSVHEFEDGYDTVEWAAKLPGSNGDVGMYGASYFGMTQWQAAVMRPPSLKSMAPGITWGNYLNGAQFRGGVRELGLRIYWWESVLALDSLFREYRKDREKLGELLPAHVSVVDNLPEEYGTLPLKNLPDPGGVLPHMFEALDLGIADDVWKYLNIDGRYEDVEVPTFHIGCWYDVFLGETLRQYEAMKEVAAERGSMHPRLLVGPWTHATTFPSMIGDLDFGLASSGQFLDCKGDMTDYHLLWFDATLKDDEDSLADESPIKVFVMVENRWRSYDEWPVPGSREEKWYLHAGGILSREEPAGDSTPDEYDYDPEDPVPTVGGALLMPGVYRAGARDQRPVEERPDVLVYTSEELAEDYTVIGEVYATLYAASSAPDTDFLARLVDVYPDGRAIGVTDGIIRASARESYPAPGVIEPVEPSPIVPGGVYEYTIDLWATGITFPKGHRIRVEITSSSFPRWDRNLNTGEDTKDASRSEVARQRIFYDPERPSSVTLTMVEG